MSPLIWPAIALLALLALYAIERDQEGEDDLERRRQDDEPVDGEGPGRIGEDGE